MATGIQISSSSDITVGTTAISNGTEGRVLFQGSGNVVQQDSALFWDNTLKRLTLRAVGTAATDIPFRVRNSADTRDIIRIQGNESTVLQSGQYASCTFVQDGNEAATLILRTTGNLQAELGNDFNAAPGSTYTGALKLYNWGSVLRTRIQAVGTSYLADSTSRLVIGSTTAEARLDVRAQGALSTDIAFRVRNSADTANILEQRGDSNLILTGVAPRMTYASANNGGSISHHPRGDSAINLKHSFTFFQSGFSDGSQSTAPKLNMICADITNFGINNGFHWYFNNNLNPLDSERALWLTPKKTLSIFTGTGPDAYTAKADSFELYSADRGGTAGRASAHFRSEDGTINVLGDLSGIGTSTPGARLDVRAQGALSTDIAFRVRNSADDRNIFSILGNGDIEVRTNRVSLSQSTRLSIGGSNSDNGLDAANYTENTIVGFNNTNSGRRTTIIGSSNTNANGVNPCTTIGYGNSNRDNGLVVGHSNNLGGIVLGSSNTGGSVGRTTVIGDSNTVSEPNGNPTLPMFLLGNGVTIPNNSVANNCVFLSAGNNATAPFNTFKNDNLLIGSLTPWTANFDNNSRGVFYTKNGTAPTTLAADSFGMYSSDIVAGNAAPHFRTENGSVVKLYQQTSTGTETVADVVQYLKNLGLLV